VKPQVLTAYSLRTGLAIWLDAGGGWSDGIEDAKVATSENEVEAMKAQAARSHAANEVFEIYMLDVTVTAAAPRPVKYREYLRSEGPTTHPHFGRQAERPRRAG
jgi:hypothetical protein